MCYNGDGGDIMKVHRFINDPNELLKQGQEIVKRSADNKFVHRVSMVNLVLSGMTPGLLAQYCGDGERTINTWVKRVDENGWDSLVAIKQKGRPKLLTDDQINEIRQAVNDDPEDHGYHVWDGPTLSDFIKCKCQYKNVGFIRNKNVGFHTFLFRIFYSSSIMYCI